MGFSLLEVAYFACFVQNDNILGHQFIKHWTITPYVLREDDVSQDFPSIYAA